MGGRGGAGGGGGGGGGLPKRLFLRGYEEMMKRLSPEWVIFNGKVPEECDWNVIRVQPHYDDIVKRRKANEISVSAGNP